MQRTLKYVKYLPSEGFDSIVVSGRPRWLSRLRDTSLSGEVPPETILVRARTLPLDQAQGKLDGLLRRAGLPSKAVRAALWPDELVGWIPAAVWHGLRAVRVHRPDVIYSTSLPATSHLAALIVHRITGLPWVADFRDAWTFDPGPAASAYAPPGFTTALFERRVIAEAAYITVACASIQLLDLPPHDRRRVVIPNGVDPDDLGPDLSVEHVPVRQSFRLSHVGSLYGTRDAGPVVAALQDVIGRGLIDANHFELHMVGNTRSNVVERNSLPITFTGFVDHRRAVSEMASATTLLFHQPPEQLGSSGKIYEYLASGRPILCVAHPDNIAYRLVRELGAGECADTRDLPAVIRALERLIEKWKNGKLGLDLAVRDEALRRFSRQKLAGDLARVLNTTIEEHAPSNMDDMPDSYHRQTFGPVPGRR